MCSCALPRPRSCSWRCAPAPGWQQASGGQGAHCTARSPAAALALQAIDAEFPDEPPRVAGGAAAGADQYGDLEDDFELDDGDLFGEGEEGGTAAGAEEEQGGRGGSAPPPRKKAKHRAVMDEDEDEDE